MSETAQTPLTDLLASVPAYARAIYEESPNAHHFIPYGQLCREALAEIRTLRASLAAMRGSEHPGPRERCSDCSRVMVWQRSEIDGHYVGSWMCPNCCHDRITKAEASLAAMTARAEKAEHENKLLIEDLRRAFNGAGEIAGKLDSAIAALIALGCELRDGVLIWLPISPPPTPAKEQP